MISALIKKFASRSLVYLEAACKPSFKNPFLWLFFTLIVVNLSNVYAVELIDPVYGAMKTNIDGVMGNLQRAAIKLFFVLASIQFSLTMYGELKGNGDLESAMGKIAKSILWIAFCFWLMSDNHASNFIRNTIQYFLDHAIGFATGKITPMDVTGVIGAGMDGLSSIGSFFYTMGSKGVFSWSSGFDVKALGNIIYTAVCLIIIVVIIVVVTVYMAIKVFMLKIEVLLTVMLLPLNLAFLGLNSLRDQGFAPFKGMIALVFRILIMGVIIGSLSSIASNMESYTSSVLNAYGDKGDFLVILIGMCIGYAMLGYMAYKSDVIASSLSSGSSSLGSQSDTAGAAMAGAIAGALAAAGVGSALNAAEAGKSAVADMMNGGQIDNASSQGQGKTPDPPPAKPASNASIGGGSSGGASGKSSTSNSSAPPAPPAATATGGGSAEAAPAGGYGADAGIEAPATNNNTGGSSGSGEQGKSKDSATPPPRKGFMDHLKAIPGQANKKVAEQDHSTSVSINTTPHE